MYVRLQGTKGKLAKQQLTKQNKASSKKRVKFKFKRSSSHMFKMKGKDIGELKTLNIEVIEK